MRWNKPISKNSPVTYYPNNQISMKINLVISFWNKFTENYLFSPQSSFWFIFGHEKGQERQAILYCIFSAFMR